MKFTDITGHKAIIDSLREAVDTDHIPHAILIGGQEGIGKMRLARAFVSYLYCMDRHDGDSCGKCPACLQNAHHNNPDVHFIFPRTGASTKSTDTFLPQWNDFLDRHSYMPKEEWAKTIEAGNTVPVIYRSDATEISRTAALSSFAYRYKTYVIWMPERMQPQCANALLKLLEEPFPDTIFLLVSNEPDKLLPTIFSRAQRFNLKPLSEAEVAGILTGEGIAYQEAQEVAALSEGSMVKAFDMTGEGGEIKEFSAIFIQMMRLAYTRNAGALRMLSDSVAAMGREKTARFLAYCARMTRESFIFNLKTEGLNSMTKAEADFNVRFSPYINHKNVERIMSEIQRAHDDVLRNANARLVLFDFMLKLMIQLRK
ncbi:MAG: DNA polymerase III subunit delta [Muribaculaceae bacterium]|nr:DNA polymerase III subunit delta [Muribaculaceae bacterium]